MNTTKPYETAALEKHINILIVDDLPENLRILSNILKKEGYVVRPALNGNAALNAVLHTPADLVLLDMRMPEMDGIKVCRHLKDHEATRDIPVIFISAADDMDNKIAGFKAGGVDYIVKPFQPDEVLARIRVQLELQMTRKALEQASRDLEQKVKERTAELMAANEALGESEEKYRTLNENIPLGVFRTSISGKLLSSNQALVNMFGFSDENELKTQSMPADIYANVEDRRKFFDALRNNRNLTGYEILLKRRDGTEFHAAVSARIIYDSRKKKEYIDGVVEDISEKKKIEERNRLLEKQLHQTQKMEAIGTLAGGIAHDFNNILSAVLGFTELAKLNLYKAHDISRYLDQIFSAGLRARDLIKQILIFSRHSDIQRNPIMIVPLVKEALKFLSSSLPSTIEIRQELEDINNSVLADPTQIQQIVMNLCTNAAHAMKGKGTLDVRLAGTVIEDKDETNYKNLSPGDYIKLAVSDTGHGIEPAIIHRIFEPFFTTKNTGEGTGMGLAVVHGIIKEMEGAITVYSEVGKGTTFNVLLPVYSGTKKQETFRESETIVQGGGNVLLVDDEKAIVRCTREILVSLGYDVETRHSSREALNCFKSGPDRFDLVLTDMTMPEMTGVELAAEIHKISPDIPILLSTGFINRITEQMRIENGINEVLPKPILKNELAQAIKAALAPVREQK